MLRSYKVSLFSDARRITANLIAEASWSRQRAKGKKFNRIHLAIYHVEVKDFFVILDGFACYGNDRNTRCKGMRDTRVRGRAEKAVDQNKVGIVGRLLDAFEMTVNIRETCENVFDDLSKGLNVHGSKVFRLHESLGGGEESMKVFLRGKVIDKTQKRFHRLEDDRFLGFGSLVGRLDGG